MRYIKHFPDDMNLHIVGYYATNFGAFWVHNCNVMGHL